MQYVYESNFGFVNVDSHLICNIFIRRTGFEFVLRKVLFRINSNNLNNLRFDIY